MLEICFTKSKQHAPTYCSHLRTTPLHQLEIFQAAFGTQGAIPEIKQLESKNKEQPKQSQ